MKKQTIKLIEAFVTSETTGKFNRKTHTCPASAVMEIVGAKEPVKSEPTYSTKMEAECGAIAFLLKQAVKKNTGANIRIENKKVADFLNGKYSVNKEKLNEFKNTIMDAFEKLGDKITLYYQITENITPKPAKEKEKKEELKDPLADFVLDI